MIYLIKRMLLALVSHRQLLLLVLFPPLVFLFASAMTADRFLVYQSIEVEAEKPITAKLVHGYVSSGLFRETADGRYQILRPTEQRMLYYTMEEGEAIRVSYEGVDSANGSDLVLHFSERIIRALSATGAQGQTVTISTPLMVEGIHALWRAERMTTLIQYAVISLLAVLSYIAFKEFTDPSFKTERNAARYLEVPLLGSLPKVEPVLQSLKRKESKAEKAAHGWEVSEANHGVPSK